MSFQDKPKECIEKIYQFLKIPTYDHRFTNLDQLIINNTQYDDSVLEAIHHDVREDKIERNYYDIEKYLTKSAIEKYTNVKVLF